jgi:hypothetical protein
VPVEPWKNEPINDLTVVRVAGAAGRRTGEVIDVMVDVLHRPANSGTALSVLQVEKIVAYLVEHGGVSTACGRGHIVRHVGNCDDCGAATTLQSVLGGSEFASSPTPATPTYGRVQPKDPLRDLEGDGAASFFGRH